MNNRFETFTVLIAKINKSIKKIKNFEMAEYNLRSLHTTCLFLLYINESLTATDLCDKCQEDKAAISRALDYLEKNDFVICSSNQKKRYNSPFKLTEKGVVVGKKIVDKVNNILDIIDIIVNEEERMLMYSNLTKISNTLEIITGKFE